MFPTIATMFETQLSINFLIPVFVTVTLTFCYSPDELKCSETLHSSACSTTIAERIWYEIICLWAYFSNVVTGIWVRVAPIVFCYLLLRRPAVIGMDAVVVQLELDELFAHTQIAWLTRRLD